MPSELGSSIGRFGLIAAGGYAFGPIGTAAGALLIAGFASSWTPGMIRRWHADPFGFLRPWNELPALIGSAPPTTPPRPARAWSPSRSGSVEEPRAGNMFRDRPHGVYPDLVRVVERAIRISGLLRAALLLTQHADDLPLTEPALPHRPSSDDGLSYINRGIPRGAGHVRPLGRDRRRRADHLASGEPCGRAAPASSGAGRATSTVPHQAAGPLHPPAAQNGAALPRAN
jgi:hypothetical protein